MKPAKPLDSLILTLRGQKVILDSDLAELYGVTAKRLNEQLKRNSDRFPEDFVFQLTAKENANLRSQIATSSLQQPKNKLVKNLKSQSVTSNHGGRRSLPYAFTEHGALMAANLLKSPAAIQMSLYVVRAFIKQRELLSAQSDILKRLAQMDAKLLKHDDVLQVIWRELQPLLKPVPLAPKPQIGFHSK